MSVHVDDINGIATKEVAESLLKHFNDQVGQGKADYNSSLHAGIQHEHSAGQVFTHQYVYIDSITPIEPSLLTGKGDEALCDSKMHEAYRSVLGAVAWTVLTRAELAVYVQALQRRAHAPRIIDCKRLNVVMCHMKRHKCGLKSITLKHPLKLVAFTDVAFKTQPGEAIGLFLRGLVATMCEDQGAGTQLHGDILKANRVDFIVRRQGRVVRSTFSAELHGFVDSIGQMLLKQCTLHQIYCGTTQSPERMIDLPEKGSMYPPLDICVDAKAVYDAIAVSDACEFAECSLKLHLISVRDRMTHGLIRKLYWVDTWDMLADGLTNGGIDRLLLHKVSNDCVHERKQLAISHNKVGFPSSPPRDSAGEVGVEHHIEPVEGLDAPGEA